MTKKRAKEGELKDPDPRSSEMAINEPCEKQKSPEEKQSFLFGVLQDPKENKTKPDFPVLQNGVQGKKNNDRNYKATLVEGANASFASMHSSPSDEPVEDDSTLMMEEEEPTITDDPRCPTIKLSTEEKKELWRPWKNTLIIKLFDKGPGYMQLHRRLSQKWALTGPFSLIDLGNDYFISRFSNQADYNHVLMEGPWMIGDNYLTIRKWVPRFNASVEKITRLTVWIRIPCLHIEYFDSRFLNLVGQLVGKVLRIDNTTASAERGQFARLSVEVDLTKPLLSKFRLDGKVWPIQYEGLRMLCFACGKVGHGAEKCGVNTAEIHNDAPTPNPNLPSDLEISKEDYGTWMQAKKVTRRRTEKTTHIEANGKPNKHGPERDITGDAGKKTPGEVTGKSTNPTPPGRNEKGKNPAISGYADLGQSSRFAALETLDEEEGVNQGKESTEIGDPCNSGILSERDMNIREENIKVNETIVHRNSPALPASSAKPNSKNSNLLPKKTKPNKISKKNPKNITLIPKKPLPTILPESITKETYVSPHHSQASNPTLASQTAINPPNQNPSPTLEKHNSHPPQPPNNPNPDGQLPRSDYGPSQDLSQLPHVKPPDRSLSSDNSSDREQGDTEIPPFVDGNAACPMQGIATQSPKRGNQLS